MVCVVAFVWRRLIVNPDPPLPNRDAEEPLASSVKA